MNNTLMGGGPTAEGSPVQLPGKHQHHKDTGTRGKHSLIWNHRTSLKIASSSPITYRTTRTPRHPSLSQKVQWSDFNMIYTASSRICRPSTAPSVRRQGLTVNEGKSGKETDRSSLKRPSVFQTLMLVYNTSSVRGLAQTLQSALSGRY